MNIKPLIVTGLLSLVSSVSVAENLSINISNLTQGIYFTPLLITTHMENVHLYQTGTAATMELQAMAEGGDISGLLASSDTLGAVSVANPAEGLLAPGMMTDVMTLDTGDNDRLSIVAMILPSNDGFVGLDAWPIPSEPGTYTLWLNAYDAGTEANNELIADGSGMPGTLGVPANPGHNGGVSGTGVTTNESNQYIHIHRGNLGDTDAEGGKSDFDSRIHRWLNPVAKVVVTVH